MPEDALQPDATPLVAEATRTLVEWSALVEAVPGLSSRRDRQSPLVHLVEWYARVGTDSDCRELAPVDGLDALVDELTDAGDDELFERLASARWAILVAEDLVRVRAATTEGAQTSALRMSVSRLDLTLMAARRHLEKTRQASPGSDADA